MRQERKRVTTSFFGFDTVRPQPGCGRFSQAHNPFAGLSNRQDDGDALEFEETYDGLGDQLDETDDAFNDDTFGDAAGSTTTGPVGKDFDFFGQTAKVSGAIDEEHVLFNRQHPGSKPAPARVPAAAMPAAYNYNPHPAYKPSRTGYEKYKDESFDDLQVDATLWGVAPKKQATPAAGAAASAAAASSQAAAAAAANRKFLSLEEVEAQMRAQQKPVQPGAPSRLTKLRYSNLRGLKRDISFPCRARPCPDSFSS